MMTRTEPKTGLEIMNRLRFARKVKIMNDMQTTTQPKEEKRRTTIVVDRSKVAEKETVRLFKSDKARRDQLFEEFRNSEDDCLAVFMRYIFNLGLDAYEKEYKRK